MGDRDIAARPYTADEIRVVEWIRQHSDMGGGDDPIGFLLASHEQVARQRNHYRDIIIQTHAAFEAMHPQTNELTDAEFARLWNATVEMLAREIGETADA